MKTLLIASVMSLSFATTAMAQAGGAQSTRAIKETHTVNAGTAERGRNSFTQQQAREHIAHSGYTNVSGLAKGDDGIWRGTARKRGRMVHVALDFKGNVSTSRR